MMKKRAFVQRECGQVFFLVAALFAIFGGMTAVAVDLGSYMADRRDLQNAADAIALAASQELPDVSGAQTAANTWAANNAIDLSLMAVTFTAQSLPDEPNPKVIIDLQRDHGFAFARLMGIESASVTASATAIRTSPGGSPGLMPWGVQAAVKDLAAPGDEVVLKYDASGGQNGNFGALRIDGNGASTYEDSVKYGSQEGLCTVGATDCPDTDQVQTEPEPGNMTGPTRQAVDYRITNTESGCDTWDEVVATAADGTHGLTSACNPFGPGGNSASLRIVIVPIVETQCNDPCSVTVVEFALLFLEGYGSGGCTGNNCEIRGRFINSNTNYGAFMGTFDADTFAHFVRLVN